MTMPRTLIAYVLSFTGKHQAGSAFLSVCLFLPGLRQVKAPAVCSDNLAASKHLRGAMPYATIAALPASVRNYFPLRAQDLYACATYPGEPRREEIAQRTAWAAVKHQFHKGSGRQWQPGASDTGRTP